MTDMILTTSTPRHYVKDDSIENNLVLVEKESNGHKSDNFPIEHNSAGTACVLEIFV